MTRRNINQSVKPLTKEELNRMVSANSNVAKYMVSANNQLIPIITEANNRLEKLLEDYQAPIKLSQ